MYEGNNEVVDTASWIVFIEFIVICVLRVCHALMQTAAIVKWIRKKLR